MAKPRISKHLELLKILKKAKPDHRRAILDSADKELIDCLCECCLNLLSGKVRCSRVTKNKLKRYAPVIRELANRKTSAKRRKNLLMQKGGFLPALLAPIVSVAGGLIGELVGNLINK